MQSPLTLSSQSTNTELQILTAMPSLSDGYFEQSVILLCEYDDKGAIGMVINSPSHTMLSDLLAEIGITDKHYVNQPIFIGGPVQPELCWILHSTDVCTEHTVTLNKQMGISHAEDLLPDILDGRPPSWYLMGAGYAGWQPGQLDDEIAQESWWLGSMETNLLLNNLHNLSWELVMQQQGLSSCAHLNFCHA